MAAAIIWFQGQDSHLSSLIVAPINPLWVCLSSNLWDGTAGISILSDEIIVACGVHFSDCSL